MRAAVGQTWWHAGLGCVCVCLVEGCGSKVGLRRRGVIISLCHRCISLEYLWFYTPVTQLCVFALTLKQRRHSCRSCRTESAIIVTKLIAEECEGKCRSEFCAEALRETVTWPYMLWGPVTCLHAGEWCWKQLIYNTWKCCLCSAHENLCTVERSICWSFQCLSRYRSIIS